MPSVDNANLFGRNSRLRFYSIVSDEKNNVVRLGMRDKRFTNRIKNLVDYELWRVPAKYEFRPDLISFVHYGTPQLWWVITQVNEIFHPAKELTANKLLKIPNQEQLFSLLAV
jgi:hypothetical protein